MSNYELVRDEKRVEEILKSLDISKPIYLDTETIGLYGFVRLLQIYQEGMQKPVIFDGYYVNIDKIAKFLENKFKLVGYNLSYDFSCLNINPAPENFEDLFFASKLKFYMLDKYNLDNVLENIGINISSDKKAMQKASWDGVLTEKQLIYAAEDVLYLPILYEEVKPILKDYFVYTLDKVALHHTLKVQKIGLKVDREKHKTKFKETLSKLEEIANQLPINYNSPKQVTEFLGTKKADVDTLKNLMYEGDKRAELIYYAKKYDKQLQFLRKYDKDRVYGHFNPAGAVSGRFSCSQENIQQIPRDVKSVFGFSKEENKVFVSVDYPQIELRLAVCIWGEPLMEKLFKEGKDLHIATASFIYNKPENEITKTERQVAKSANFGLLYGMGIERFRQYVRTNTGILLSFEEAKEAREKWLTIYQGFWLKHREVAKEYRKNGYYVGSTALGRVYKGKTLNDSLNIQIQGSGAELIKLALHYAFKKKPDLKVCNIIHDALYVEATKNEAEEAGQVLKEAMQEAWNEMLPLFPKCNDLPLPLEVEISTHL